MAEDNEQDFRRQSFPEVVSQEDQEADEEVRSNVVQLRRVSADELAELVATRNDYAIEPGNQGSMAALNEAVLQDRIRLAEAERLARHETEIDAANRIFRENLVPVAQSVVHTAIHGRNERARLAAQQMILDRVMGRVQDNPPEPPEDPFQKLLASCVKEISPAEAQAKIKDDLKNKDGN